MHRTIYNEGTVKDRTLASEEAPDEMRKRRKKEKTLKKGKQSVIRESTWKFLLKTESNERLKALLATAFK